MSDQTRMDGYEGLPHGARRPAGPPPAAGDCDKQRARKLLVKLADEGAQFTPWVALELARMLLHIAGGDGRGVYTVYWDPEGDRR